MNKPELIESVADATGQTKTDTEQTLDAFLDRIANALTVGERVDWRGFGIWEAKETKARKGRNPATGEALEIPASRRVTFRPSKELKNRLLGERAEPAAEA